MKSSIDLDALRKEIEITNTRWSSAINSGNATEIRECLDEEVLFLGPGAPMICGINDVVAEAETWVEAGTSNVLIEILEVYGDGEIAYQVGTYSSDNPQDDGTVKTFKGKYIDIFHRQDDGSWKIHASIQNSDSE